MMSIWNSNFNVGDKVLFLGTDSTLYDKDGNELYGELNRGEIYTVKEILILSIKIEEFDGIYLKTHFRKIINLLKKEFLNMNKTSATVVADSINPQGDRLTSLLITFPRILLSEINTHRMLSKNTSSSRAIPFHKMVETVQNNPFIPIAWQKTHSGMQGTEYKTGDSEIKLSESKWLEARDNAVNSATLLTTSDCVTKQLCNRLLEPFMWTTMLITGPREGWDNFHSLRNPVYEIDLDNLDSYKNEKTRPKM